MMQLEIKNDGDQENLETPRGENPKFEEVKRMMQLKQMDLEEK